MKNANQFREMYAGFGINIDNLGCIMLDYDPKQFSTINIPEELLYTSPKPERFWIKGFVAQKTTPHVTLLYGLLSSGQTIKKQVDMVIKDLPVPLVQIESVGYFESPYSDEPYYCIVGHVQKSQELLNLHHALELLPHINTFMEYKLHLTIAYIKKDDYSRDVLIRQLAENFKHQYFTATKLNYGK